MSKNKKVGLLLVILAILIVLGVFIAFKAINNKSSAIIINYFDGKQSSIKVSPNTKFRELPITQREGYKFAGFSTSIDNINLVNMTSEIGTTNEIYAIYVKNTYELVIDPVDGTFDEHSGTITKNLEYESSITINNPSKVGYEFKEWNVSGKGSKIENNKFTMGSENAKLTAVYEAKEYNVVLDYDGGNIDGKEKEVFKVKYGESIALSTPSKKGYVFAGYALEAGIYKDYSFTLNVDKDVKITAKWTKINNNTSTNNEAIITPKNDDKSSVIVDDKKEEETKPEEQKPTVVKEEKSTYVVNYYLMNTDGTAYVLDDSITGEINANTKLTITPKEYENFITPQSIEIQSDATAKVYKVDFKYDRKKFKLIVNTNGGNLISDFSEEYYFGQEIELTLPKKDYYNFKNWNANNGSIVNNILTMPASDVTLTAVYTPIEYQITYELNNGTPASELKTKYTFEDQFTLPQVEKEGFIFDGWSTNLSDNKDKNVFVKNSYGNLYYIANFTPITYEVLYIDGTNRVTVTYNYKEAISYLPPGTNTSLEFLGWYDDLGNKVEVGYVINKNNTFTARYKEIRVENSAVTYIENMSQKEELLNDTTADNNLRYVGANPDNYVLFNNELWRIIGVFYNVSDSTGDTSAKLKLIRNDYLFSVPWSTTTKEVNKTYGVNDFETSDVKRTLNEFYYNSNNCQDIEILNQQKQDLLNNRAQIEESTSETKEEDLSNIDKQIAELEEQINYESKCNSFSSEAQEYAVDAVYSTGSNGEANWGTSKALDFYNYERSSESSKACIESVLCNDSITRSLTSTTKVGLMYLSDYTFAVGGSSRNVCLNKAVYAWWDQYECLDNNWMVKDIEYTMSEAATLEFAYKVYITGKDMVTTAASMPHNVRPVVYLNSKTTITGGNGTIDNPFVLGKGW